MSAEEPAVAEQKVKGLVPDRPTPDEWVELKHDGIEKTQTVHPRSVPHWEARGWTVVGAADAPVTPEQITTQKARGAGTES